MTTPNVYARLADGLSPHFGAKQPAGPRFLHTGVASLLLGNERATSQVYTNAQIDDYRPLTRPDFPWRPPLRLSVRARFSHNSGQLTGTAGFGFWNDPLRMTGLRRVALPQALWFFYAGPDADMRLALDQPAWGWKASVIDTRTSRFLLAGAPACSGRAAHGSSALLSQPVAFSTESGGDRRANSPRRHAGLAHLHNRLAA